MKGNILKNLIAFSIFIIFVIKFVDGESITIECSSYRFVDGVFAFYDREGLFLVLPNRNVKTVRRIKKIDTNQKAISDYYTRRSV